MKILAIGGGEIGRLGTSIETEKIDRKTIKLTGKQHPKLLFIPTASSDSEGYVEVVRKYFGKRLGCHVDVLYLLKSKLSNKKIRKKILNSDIIYVGGGNTLKMMTIWRKFGVDIILQEAAKKDIVLSGVSAGAICWFRYGNSDSRKYVKSGTLKYGNPAAPLIKIEGLNLVPALCCPHYDGDKERKPSLKLMMKNTPGVAIALDNCAALEIVGNKYQIITSKNSANAYKVFWRRGKFFEEKIIKASNFQPVDQLFSK